MNPINFGRKLVVNVLGGVVALGLLLGSVAPAFAQTEAPAHDPAKQTARLEKAYAKAQEWLGKQAERLSKADEVEAKVQELIAKAQSEGKDTSTLEVALADFEAGVAAAQAEHDEAAGILSAHAGFDDSGKVTNIEQARETVVNAGKALRDARQLIHEAGRELREAVRDFRVSVRDANRPGPKPTATP
ncbi:MAG: hypothetical protein ACT4QE_04355 [Anaerolineales bacterium]